MFKKLHVILYETKWIICEFEENVFVGPYTKMTQVSNGGIVKDEQVKYINNSIAFHKNYIELLDRRRQRATKWVKTFSG